MTHTTTRPIRAAARSRPRKPLVLALVAALGIAPLAASAATTSVTSPGDTNPASTATCTLRQAIVSMNNATTEHSSAPTAVRYSCVVAVDSGGDQCSLREAMRLANEGSGNGNLLIPESIK